jgi:hypothetical protein
MVSAWHFYLFQAIHVSPLQTAKSPAVTRGFCMENIRSVILIMQTAPDY